MVFDGGFRGFSETTTETSPETKILSCLRHQRGCINSLKAA
jgi:hypothetical protein